MQDRDERQGVADGVRFWHALREMVPSLVDRVERILPLTGKAGSECFPDRVAISPMASHGLWSMIEYERVADDSLARQAVR